MTAPGDRTVWVPLDRFDGWVERFTARHGELSRDVDGPRVTLTAADGAVASFSAELPPADFVVLLVRRGGFAVGVVRAGTLAASKSGSRYVQSRTKAGGWSQSRYARRRANQADALVDSCAAHLSRLTASHREVEPLFGGGDRPLVLDVLQRSEAAVRLAERWLSVQEPGAAALADAVVQVRSRRLVLNHLA